MLSFFAQVSSGEVNLPKGDLTRDDVLIALRVVFGVVGAIALLIITLSAFRYVLSQGDPQSTAKAKNGILYALIGLVIAIFATVIVNYVVTNI